MTRPTVRRVVVLLGFLCGLGPPAAIRAADPSQRWFTLETPHFYVHYYRSVRHDLRAAAQNVARSAELAHRVLAPIFRHAPRERTHIVVTDDTDGANGSAQVVPYNVIRAYVTGPDSLSSLNDYDHWMYGLIAHEYAHILHIDTIHGLPRLVNAIFGKSWAPNQLQPRWFIEGLATHHESARTAGGRVRSSIFDMHLRAAVLEGRFLTFDQISSSTRYYPRGVVPYLYGSRFLKYLADRFGEDALARVSHIYGGEGGTATRGALPYQLNRVAQAVFGRTFAELYADFTEYLRRVYALQRGLVARRGVTASVKVTDHGESCQAPRLSDDGRELVFVHDDGHDRTYVTVLDTATGREVERVQSLGGDTTSFTPDRRFLVYEQPAVWRSFYSYHDLYVRRRSAGTVRRLTFGERARDPVVSPDGRTVVYVANELGDHRLKAVSFDGGRPRLLLAGANGDQFFGPRFSPDGRRVVFSRWRAGGLRDIQILDLTTRKLEDVTRDRALDVDPHFSPDGRRVYFSSDRTGIFNVYRYDLDARRLRQVTNVLGGAFTPAVTPDERTLYYVGFSARGYDLHRMELREERLLEPLPYVDTRPAPVKVPAGPDYPARPYSPLGTLYPRSWFFSVGSDAYGTTLGLNVRGGDVAGWHSYAVNASASVTRGYPSYALTYGYGRLWPALRLDTSRYESPRGGLVVDGQRRNYREQGYSLGASVGLPVLRLPLHTVSLSLGYRASWMRHADADREELLVRPGMMSPQYPEVGFLSGISFGATYRNVERYTWSVSTERGRQVSLSMRADHAAFGSDYFVAQLNWSWTEYIPMPWRRDHVLALGFGGGIGRGDLRRRGIFFLGGFPEQNLVTALLDQSSVGGLFLRGYAPGTVAGDQYHLMNAEYRFPLFNIEKGVSSLPIYANHVHLAAFCDVGNAFFGHLKPSELKVGVGGEVLLEGVMFYVLPMTLRVGYAKGLMEEGSHEFHVLLGNPF
ncbi:MAG: PD40 domain-containing protein [Deltaproteobacteria bacterium]|nr:PD40 domain-containing protein [Deltaproteobacteria bacterium]